VTRWLVTGAGGQLGRDLVTVLEQAGEKVTAATRADLDLNDLPTVRATVPGHDVVINTASWTDVDGAEANEGLAHAVNADGAGHLAAVCAKHGAKLVHLSTDYVFPGDGTSPYAEDAPTGPVNAYGRTKLAGERYVLDQGGYVVRTAWLYGAHGRNFVKTMLRLAAERDTLTVVDDQRGQPTWSMALARRLVELANLADAPPGAYHGTASGETTWCGLAREIFAAAGLDPERVRPITSDQYPLPAKRPAYSVLGHDRWAEAGLPPMTDWKAMLHEAMPTFLARTG